MSHTGKPRLPASKMVDGKWSRAEGRWVPGLGGGLCVLAGRPRRSEWPGTTCGPRGVQSRVLHCRVWTSAGAARCGSGPAAPGGGAPFPPFSLRWSGTGRKGLHKRFAPKRAERLSTAAWAPDLGRE
ncbi:hypothetical protein NDU88_004948 [Pleurodeles waltl]|uniref:Uncharacterized protein n=1 Tax=Pleurodeles waltl TaxID=8319 RepID=A0AAV7VIF9_PLEWA|nr:hypothetical protein NDU88_004948 [Pleurodeles waltl]